jgi:hypothetical protein
MSGGGWNGSASLCVSALTQEDERITGHCGLRVALDVRRLTLTFDPADAADRERIARLYRQARVV